MWFNDGGPTGNFPAGTDYLNFAAQRQGNDALLQWYALTDTATGNYQLQRSLNGTDYTAILDTAAMHLNPGTYAYTDKDIFPQDTAVYYRLMWNLTGSTGTFYAPVRKLTLADSAQAQIVFDAEMNGTNAVLADWTSYLDGTTTSYKLERQINDGDYKQVYTVTAERHYGQHYAFRDLPGNLARGTQLHYRLTAITDDGRMVVLPVRTVIWGSAGYVSNVFPNPNNDGNITINWHAPAGTVMNLNIIDINGVVRYTGTAKAGPGNNTTQLQTFHRPRGTYLLRMDIGGQVYTTSLVYQ